MFAAVFELIADESQPEQPAAESVLLVVGFGAFCARCFLRERLMADCKAENEGKMAFYKILW